MFLRPRGVVTEPHFLAQDFPHRESFLTSSTLQQKRCEKDRQSSYYELTTMMKVSLSFLLLPLLASSVFGFVQQPSVVSPKTLKTTTPASDSLRDSTALSYSYNYNNYNSWGNDYYDPYYGGSYGRWNRRVLPDGYSDTRALRYSERNNGNYYGGYGGYNNGYYGRRYNDYGYGYGNGYYNGYGSRYGSRINLDNQYHQDPYARWGRRVVPDSLSDPYYRNNRYYGGYNSYGGYGSYNNGYYNNGYYGSGYQVPYQSWKNYNYGYDGSYRNNYYGSRYGYNNYNNGYARLNPEGVYMS